MAELETLARPYSKAAFEFAAQSSQMEHWGSCLSTLARVVEQPNFVMLLSSPDFTTSRASEILFKICD